MRLQKCLNPCNCTAPYIAAPNSLRLGECRLSTHLPCQGQLTLNYGGGGTSATVLYGRASFEEHARNPLLMALPLLIHIKGEAGRTVEWLDTTLQFIACESHLNHPGAQMMITYLSSILFIQAVRA